jgi:hypothetical protein
MQFDWIFTDISRQLFDAQPHGRDARSRLRALEWIAAAVPKLELALLMLSAHRLRSYRLGGIRIMSGYGTAARGAKRPWLRLDSAYV